MEVPGVSSTSTFGFPFLLASAPSRVAFRRLPPASTLFRSSPPPYVSLTPRRVTTASPSCAAAPPPDPPASVEKEARAILRDFLKEQVSDPPELAASTRDEIAELLASKLRSLHESEQLLGLQLALPQLTDVFTPYLRSLILREYRDIRIVGGDEQLPSAQTARESTWLKRKSRALALHEIPLLEGCPPPHVLHLMNLGLNLHQIQSMVRINPYLVTPTIKQKLDRVMEFLVSLGVPESDVPRILHLCPHWLGFNISETVMPIMALLESKGVDKAQWPKIIHHCPTLFKNGKAKVEAVVGYFSEIGLSATTIGGILTYSPWVLVSNIERKIKPIHKFLLDIGFTMEEVCLIIHRTRGTIFRRSLERNLMPKWEFLLTMGYSRSDLLGCPNYFFFSLEKRIKPRCKRAAELGIHCRLGGLLHPSNERFELFIQRKKESCVVVVD